MTSDQAPGRPPGENAPVRLPVGYVDEALELLQRLNQLRFRDGSLLCAEASIGGFETWWFIQHDLLWSMLIPYCQHRTQFDGVLRQAPFAASELQPDVRAVCGRLGLPLEPQQEGSSSAVKVLKTILGRLSQSGLAVFSLASLLGFRIARRDTLLYVLDQVSPGSDHDFRLSPVYTEVRKRGYRFSEYLHIRGFEEQYRQTWWNILRRRRPAVLFEMIVRLASKFRRRQPPAPRQARDIAIDSSEPDQEFLAAIAGWALTQARRLVFETDVISRLLRFQRVRRAVIVDHSSVIGQLVAACRLAGIPTLGYMHGNFTRFHAGLMAYGFGDARRHTFGLYGVWSDHYRARLLAGELYDKTNTFTSGPLRAPSVELLKSVAAARGRQRTPVRALLISEKYAPWDEVRTYVQQLASDPRIDLKLKLRPGEETPHLAPGEDGVALELETVRTAGVYEALAECDVVLGTHSTVLYEAVLALRPVVLLNTTFTYGNDMAREGLASFAESPEALCEAVIDAHSLPDAELVRRKSALWGDKLTDGARRLFEVAEKELWPPPANRTARTRAGGSTATG